MNNGQHRHDQYGGTSVECACAIDVQDSNPRPNVRGTELLDGHHRVRCKAGVGDQLADDALLTDCVAIWRGTPV
jgi:hypothetical protein